MRHEAVLPDAGSRDLAAAAAALRSRLPGAARRRSRGSPTTTAGRGCPAGRSCSRRDRPAALAAVRRQPGAAAAGGPPGPRSRALAADDGVLERGRRARGGRSTPTSARPPPAGVTPEHPVAFFCAEYAVHRSLPIYSGGLGALAGDILKEASDRALPLVAIGLMYRRGYFRQRIDRSGWQHEYWVHTDPERVPAALVTGDDGEPLTVTVPIGGARRRRADLAGGRRPRAAVPARRRAARERRADRWITSRLYVGDPDTRLAQYALLGLGGVRALEALGVEPGVVHLNEGHAAFAALELRPPGADDGVLG